MAELKKLYVKRNNAPFAPRGSWAEHVDECKLNKISADTMQQGETAGNGALSWLKDNADAGFFTTPQCAYAGDYGSRQQLRKRKTVRLHAVKAKFC